MTWVKICGITNLEDALIAVDAGADAVGFVFHEKSPRKVDLETVQGIVAELPQWVEKVGVFAGESIERAEEIGQEAPFDALQVHLLTYAKEAKTEGLTARASNARFRIYLALPASIFMGTGVTNVAGFAQEHSTGILHALLLDSGNLKQPGGTGKTFDWSDAAETVRALSLHQKVVVAGGLAPQNVSEAIAILSPWGVDVASGVEARPGKKDPLKVRAFVKAVREADQKAS